MSSLTDIWYLLQKYMTSRLTSWIESQLYKVFTWTSCYFILIAIKDYAFFLCLCIFLHACTSVFFRFLDYLHLSACFYLQQQKKIIRLSEWKWKLTRWYTRIISLYVVSLIFVCLLGKEIVYILLFVWTRVNYKFFLRVD